MNPRGGKDQSYHQKAFGRWIGKGGARRATKHATLAPPLGDIFATIQHDDLEDSTDQEHDEIHITSSQYLTSYNWLNRERYLIIVPGEPPAWTPLSEPIRLRGDSGQYYRDPNAARYPIYPLEPMIQAILTQKPEFSLSGVDIIGCGSTLGNLLRFACGRPQSFRMLVEVVGNTIFFIRRENSPFETIPDVRGYGHTFPEAYTTWGAGVQGSESHQRLVNYVFAGMNFLVRFEVDGFLPALIPEGFKLQTNHTCGTVGAEADDIFLSIQGVNISSLPLTTIDAKQKLMVRTRGHLIPQCAVFDLKTRSVKRMDDQTVEEQLPRLWIRQIPNFVLAYHAGGKFDDIRILDVREKLKHWEAAQQPALVRYANLLKIVVSFARSMDRGRFEIEHEEGRETLYFREPGGMINSVLPTHLTSKWDF